MNIEAIDRQLADIQPNIDALIERKRILECHKRGLQSLEFIRANNITRNDVEMSSPGDGKPWFGDIWKFGKWLKTNSKKRFCEWNGGIYFTAEIIAERMSEIAPGRVEDLPKEPA